MEWRKQWVCSPSAECVGSWAVGESGGRCSVQMHWVPRLARGGLVVLGQGEAFLINLAWSP